jgi:DNA-binding SARP family transcriptional activator
VTWEIRQRQVVGALILKRKVVALRPKPRRGADDAVRDRDEAMEPNSQLGARSLQSSASAGPTILRISLLGPLEVRDGNQLVRLAGIKQRALLCWLALNPRTSVSFGALTTALWGDASPTSARAKIHTYVCELRKALCRSGHASASGWPVLTYQGGYQLSNDVDLDSRQFESRASEARRAARLGEHARASGLFAYALEMWRGPALADVPSYAIQAAANALNEERLLAFEGKAEADIHLGWYDEVVAELSPVAAANPLRERLRGELMLALYRRGARNEALAVHREGHQVITRELGMPPSPQLRRLQQLILRDDPVLWTRPPNDLLSMEATTGEA